MFGKVLNTTRGKWALVLGVISVLGVCGSISEGTIVAGIPSLVLVLVLAVGLYISAAKTIATPAAEIWKKWADVPMNDAQMRRLERGIECGFTPRKVCIDAKYAIIVGSERNAYKTTLTRCSCPDFQKRKLPCKHMYFLALKTGAIDGNDLPC